MPFTCPHCPRWGADFSSPTLSGLESHLDAQHPTGNRGSLTVTFTPQELDLLCKLIRAAPAVNSYDLTIGVAQRIALLAKLNYANIPAC